MEFREPVATAIYSWDIWLLKYADKSSGVAKRWDDMLRRGIKIPPSWRVRQLVTQLNATSTGVPPSALLF